MSRGGVIGNRKRLTRGRTFQINLRVTISKVFGNRDMDKEGPRMAGKCFSAFLGGGRPLRGVKKLGGRTES